MATKRSSSDSPSGTEIAAVVSGGALIASILANLNQAKEKNALRTRILALQRIVADWERSYRSLEHQLGLALAANENLNREVSTLRSDLRDANGRVYACEQRALEAESRVQALEAEVEGLRSRRKEVQPGEKEDPSS